MNSLQNITDVRATLLTQYDQLEVKSDILKAPELKQLLSSIRDIAPKKRREYGQAVNQLHQELKQKVADEDVKEIEVISIDISAPFDINGSLPEFLPSEHGTIHPLMREIQQVSNIFERMGFAIEESREIDDQYHMFDTLNFPKDHPARDDYDTFQIAQTDKDGEPLVAPAHTSTMQHRILKKYKTNLDNDEPIAAVVPDRVFRNEDLDARHEHTFYQVEGVYVSKGVHVGMLITTLQQFLNEYYDKQLEVRINPFYFPFTEPSFELALSCPFCDKKGCKVCSQEGWIELVGCGLIHPNVLKSADIDPHIYTGFAWGLGIDRLVMMKNGIEDVRHFESARLDFLRQF